MEKAGLRAKGIFRMDASKRSKHTNAYFTGLGKSKRIVLFDTLLEAHTGEEILAVLAHELEKRGLQVKRQKPVPIEFEGMRFEEGFRADLIVENCVVVELKSVEELPRVHSKQLLTYLRLLDYRLGLLINFGASVIKDGIHRIVNRL